MLRPKADKEDVEPLDPAGSINNDEAFPEIIVDQTYTEEGEATANPNFHQPLLLDFIIVDQPAEPPPIKPSWFWWIAQKSMLGLRVLLASCTANYSWPTASQPYEEMIAYGCIPYLEIVAGVYLFAWYDILDIRDRLRAECRNDARLGFLVLSTKVAVACAVPTLFGLSKGLIQSRFQNEIAANAALTLLTSPPLSRIIAAVLSLPMYMGARKAINRFFPVNDYAFHPNPALKKWQKGAMILFRMIDSMSLFKFSSSIYRAYGNPALLHNKHLTAGAAVCDQVLANFIDAIAFSMPRPYPLRTLAPRVTHLPLANRAGSPANDDRIEVLEDDNEARANNTVEAYAESRANVYRESHKRFRCDNVRVTLWYSSRLLVVLGIAALVNYLLSLVQEDKETLSEPYYSIYLTVILLVTVGTEIAFQEGLPALINKFAYMIQNCRHRPTLFHHAEDVPELLPAPTAEASTQNSNNPSESTPLLPRSTSN